MTERPILFNSEMVRAILEGRKTTTRRPVKKQPPNGHYQIDCSPRDGAFVWMDDSSGNAKRWPFPSMKCPYGQPGDHLWVRETWAQCYQGGPAGGRVVYRADVGIEGNSTKIESEKVIPWKPSIHMPKWASRITLEITNVSVERVQEITGDDARMEGMNIEVDAVSKVCTKGQRDKFHDSWDAIYPNDPFNFESNPWCWVIEFKRL